jgi:hypothetical protein
MDQPNADGDVPDEKAVGLERKEPETQKDNGPAFVIKARQVPPKAFQIRRDDAEKNGGMC